MKKRQLSRLLLLLISIAAMTITISSCGDDSSDNGGTGTGDWLPMNIGCSWTFKGKYTDTFNNVTTITQKYEIVGDTTTGDGLAWKKLTDLNQTYNVKGVSVDTTWLTYDRQYLNKDSQFYSSAVQQLGGLKWTKVLKLPVTVGDTWQPDESDSLSMAQTLGLESVTCDSIGKTFSSCAKVLNYRIIEGDTIYVNKYIWFSQGNGIVKMRVEAGTTKFDLDLIGYTIK